jgi:hypothetical protein
VKERSRRRQQEAGPPVREGRRRTTCSTDLPLPSQFDRIIIAGGTIAALVGSPILLVLALLLHRRSSTGRRSSSTSPPPSSSPARSARCSSPTWCTPPLSLTATLLGVAGIYLLLLTEFLALVQVLVYGGGVVILLLFGLMLTNAHDDPIVTDGSQKPFAFGIAAIIAGVLIAAWWTRSGATPPRPWCPSASSARASSVTSASR